MREREREGERGGGERRGKEETGGRRKPFITRANLLIF